MPYHTLKLSICFLQQAQIERIESNFWLFKAYSVGLGEVGEVAVSRQLKGMSAFCKGTLFFLAAPFMPPPPRFYLFPLSAKAF